MLVSFIVDYSQRKGLGPEWKDGILDIAFDDIEESTSINELYDMARSEAHTRLYDSEYPNNYIIKDIHLS